MWRCDDKMRLYDIQRHHKRRVSSNGAMQQRYRFEYELMSDRVRNLLCLISTYPFRKQWPALDDSVIVGALSVVWYTVLRHRLCLTTSIHSNHTDRHLLSYRWYHRNAKPISYSCLAAVISYRSQTRLILTTTTDSQIHDNIPSSCLYVDASRSKMWRKDSMLDTAFVRQLRSTRL